MSFVELNRQPPAIVNWKGERFATRAFRIYQPGVSREAVLNNPTFLTDANGTPLPALGSTWADMRADTLSVSPNGAVLEAVYTYSNTARRVQRTTTTQTESVTVPWFSRRLNYQPNPAVVGGVSGKFTSYEQRQTTYPMPVTRLMVRVFFTTETSEENRLSRVMQLNNGYVGRLINLNGTRALDDAVSATPTDNDLLDLWKYEGISLQEMSGYGGSDGQSHHWFEATYNFVHEAGIWSDDPRGPVECTGIDGLDPLPSNGLNADLQTPWANSGIGDDGRAIEVWPPPFRSMFSGQSGAREWKVPPFHQIRAVAFMPVLSAEVIGSPIFVCACPYDIIAGVPTLPGLTTP